MVGYGSVLTELHLLDLNPSNKFSLALFRIFI